MHDETQATPSDAPLDMVVVCGGRNFEDREFVWHVLDAFHAAHSIQRVIEGGCRGADRWAMEWAMAKGISSHTFPADWKKHGKGAGSIRNAEMLAQNPDAVIAFPGGPGTANCVRQAEALGIPVLHFRPEIVPCVTR